MEPVRFELTRDAKAFGVAAGEFLAQRQDRNLLATVLENLASGRYGEGRPLFALGRAPGGELRAVALRTPPWPMLATELSEPDVAGLLDVWLDEEPGLNGVFADRATAGRIARAWELKSGGRARIRMREAMHALHELRDPPRPANGHLHAAGGELRDLLVTWMAAFAREAGVAGAENASSMVQAQLERRGLRVWMDGGPVAFVSLSPAVAGVVRLGPVYTPPEHRRRGYASSAVAAACRELLDAGVHTCMLFTDLANPTSNRIYADLGFVPVTEWDEYRFYSAAASG